MPIKPRRTDTALKQFGPDPTRGDCFCFLYFEYDEIMKRRATGRFSWDSMLFAAQGVGLKDADGYPVTSKDVLRMPAARNA